MLYKENIVFLILRENPDINAIKEEIRNFTDKDWNSLFDIAGRFGLLPAFYNAIITLDLEKCPHTIISKYKYQYNANLYRNLLYEQELFYIINYLEKYDILAIPIKGNILARLIYKDIANRQAGCDLDLIIPFEVREEAEKRLQEIGYVFIADSKKIDLLHEYKKEISMVKNKKDFSINLDLHWAFPHMKSERQIKAFWCNVNKVFVSGTEILLPSYEDLLLQLTLASVTRYEFVVLKYIYDIHRLITFCENRLDWKKISEKGKSFHLNSILYFSLSLARELFHTEINKEFLDLITPSFIKKSVLKLWINKCNTLKKRNEICNSYVWRVGIINYLYSKNLLDFTSLIYKKVFIPPEEVAGLIYEQKDSKDIYKLYIKRLLKVFSKRN